MSEKPLFGDDNSLPANIKNKILLLEDNFCSNRFLPPGDRNNGNSGNGGHAENVADNADAADLLVSTRDDGTTDTENSIDTDRPSGGSNNGRIRPDEGVIIVAGKNFGDGDDIQAAAAALKSAGVSCIVAKNVTRAFYRALVNIGLPVIETDIPVNLENGLDVEIDFGRGEIVYAGGSFKIPQFPEIIERILDCGGLMPYVRSEISKK